MTTLIQKRNKSTGYALCRIWFCCLFVIVNFCLRASAATVADFKARIFTNAVGNKLPYRIFVPTNQPPDAPYPLVLFLHGSGGNGNNNSSQLTDQLGPLIFVSKANQTNHPTFMVAPQCPSNEFWEDPLMLNQVVDLIAQLESEFRIDADRIYVTGLSNGGFGTWAIVTRHPELFAAAIPMSGGGEYYPLSRVARLPIWNFHGAIDTDVNVSNSDYVIDELRAAGGSPIYTRYRNGEHAIWDTAYNTPGLVDWLMHQKRGQTSTNAPLLTIEAPLNDSTVQTLEEVVKANGSLFAGTILVTNVVWKNVQSHSVGQVVGLTNWSATSIPLQPGYTNIITVTAFGIPKPSSLGAEISFNASVRIKVELPVLATILPQGLDASLSWSGGAPPYTIEESTNLAESAWTKAETTSSTSETIGVAGPARFFRITGRSSIPPMVTVDAFVPRIYADNNGAELPYRLFIPTNYVSGRKYPLVLFLHAYAEAGTNNLSQLTYQTSPLIFVSQANQSTNPCFMVAPQCPEGASWRDEAQLRQIPGLIASLTNEFSIDTDRLYITGIAFGADGVWSSITQNPDLYAAAVPISGFTTNAIDRITNLPIWAFNAADDHVLGIAVADQLISKMRAIGGHPIFTRYEKGGYAIWNTAYSDELVDWMMVQRRGFLSTNAPLVRITSPTDQSFFMTSAPALSLAGAALSPSGSVSQVRWTNSVSHVGGSTAADRSWQFENVPLQSGATNTITVIATVPSGSMDLGGTTTFDDSIKITPDQP